MADEKLSKVDALFPDKTKALEEKDQKENYSHMFSISDEKKKTIVKFLKDCVYECRQQRERWTAIRESSINNYEGVRRQSGPWEGSSNISTMVTTISSDLIHSKLFPMVWNPDIIYWKGLTAHAEEIAENNKKFAQWIFTKDMPDTQDNVDEICGRLVVDGTIAVKRRWERDYVYVTRTVPTGLGLDLKIKYKTVYDKIKKERARWDIKEIERVYFPYDCKNEDDAEYIIEEIYYTLPMLREMKEKKLIMNEVDIEDIKKSMERKFEPEGGQKARLDAAGLSAFNERIESIPIKCYEGYVKYDINDDNIREECIFMCLPDVDMYLSGKPLHCVSKIGKRPWKIGQFIKRPGCSLGKGIPELVRHLHNELDAIHNQRIDAGNMVIAPFFFYRAASGFDPSKISVKPATGIPLDDPQRDVYFPDYNPSRLSVSFQEENIVMDLISKLTYMSAANFGQDVASRPTARGTLAVISQTEQKFNLIASRVLKIVLELLSDTRKMYEEHWDNNYAKSIFDEKGRQQWNILSPEMIAGDYMAFSEIDLEASSASFEKQADQLMYQTLSPNPLIQQNPAFFWELTANFIKSMGKQNVEKYIGPKPDYEANPGLVDDENLMIQQGQSVQVNPKDDDVAHMNGHSKFKREMASVLTPDAMGALVVHIIEHKHQYQNKLNQSMMLSGGMNGQQGQAGNTGNGGGFGMGSVQGPHIGVGDGMPQGQSSGGLTGGSTGGGAY